MIFGAGIPLTKLGANLWIIGNYLRDYTVSPPRRSQFELQGCTLQNVLGKFSKILWKYRILNESKSLTQYEETLQIDLQVFDRSVSSFRHTAVPMGSPFLPTFFASYLDPHRVPPLWLFKITWHHVHRIASTVTRLFNQTTHCCVSKQTSILTRHSVPWRTDWIRGILSMAIVFHIFWNCKFLSPGASARYAACSAELCSRVSRRQ